MRKVTLTTGERRLCDERMNSERSTMGIIIAHLCSNRRPGFAHFS